MKCVKHTRFNKEYISCEIGQNVCMEAIGTFGGPSDGPLVDCASTSTGYKSTHLTLIPKNVRAQQCMSEVEIKERVDNNDIALGGNDIQGIKICFCNDCDYCNQGLDNATKSVACTMTIIPPTTKKQCKPLDIQCKIDQTLGATQNLPPRVLYGATFSLLAIICLYVY